MIIIKTYDEILKMKLAGEILAKTHLTLKEAIRPGITTREIDRIAEEFICAHGATPEQKGYNGYPYATCTSVNDVICHGFPSEQILKEGDIITVDMVVNLNGYLADSAWSYAVGEISKEDELLMKTTEECLMKAIDISRIGARIGDIGALIQGCAEPKGFSVVREFIGHGIGKDMHEEPQVPHYGRAGRGLRITEGMVFTIEPMINRGHWKSKVESDGWTAKTIDGQNSCQYEHTIAILKDGPMILTDQREYE